MYLWVDEIIVGLKEMYNTDNVYEIFDYMNIKIHKIDSNNILLKNNDSFYYRDYLGNELIFIRNDLNINLEKFILLHELGHALLHTNSYEAAFNIKHINIGKLEKQANYFAFKLLQPSFDPTDLEGLTLEQIASLLELPYKQLLEFIEIG